MKIKNIGFTLIEVLLGLAITAIIGLTIYNMFWSSMKLDNKSRHVFDNYVELLLANQVMSHDLENAISLDFSSPYPDAIIFDGQEKEFSFITQTPKGIRRIRYYLGDKEGQSISSSTIGRITNPSIPIDTNEKTLTDFLWRQESSLSDWLNQTNNNTHAQIIISQLKQGSFSCQYAAMSKDLINDGAKALDYKDTWDDKGLPLSITCSFILSDPQNKQQNLIFKRDFFLPPVPNFYNEKQ